MSLERRRTRARAGAVTVLAAALVLAGCAGADEATSPTSATDATPTPGGTLRAIEYVQPIGLDPAQNFTPTSMPITFTALYGQFVAADPDTGEYDCVLCESFTTDDAGATWDIVMPEGQTFSDGTPVDAEAVAYNWERIKDPTSGSASAGFAGQIDHIDIVDDYALTVHLVAANPGFIGLMPFYALQYIASPTALEKGQEEFNANPVGAGPFVLDSWTPGGTITLVRNDDYFGEPAYLDAIEIQGVTDGSQRLNAILSGGADLVLHNDATSFAAAEDAGLNTEIYTFNGGIGFMLNTSTPPFDDVRARQAVAYALDLEQLSDAVGGGNGSVPTTLFQSDSPLFSDIPLQTYDPEKAQELFDELAAEGDPLEFAYTVYPGTGQATFDALQAQLAAYDNVTVTADQRDSSAQGVITTSGDFEMTTSALAFLDPAANLRSVLDSEAGLTNYTRISDARLDAALDAALAATDVDAQREAYAQVQTLLAELQPYILYQEYFNGAITTDQVHGVLMNGYTTPAAANIWIQQ
ncbi:MAG: ABC transporter substrate-binding protein [Microbacterium sp.]